MREFWEGRNVSFRAGAGLGECLVTRAQRALLEPAWNCSLGPALGSETQGAVFAGRNRP